VTVRDARPGERAALEALQRRAPSLNSRGVRQSLLALPDSIELPEWQIDAGHVRVVEHAGAVAGFAVLLAPADGACELDGLLVEPEQMGTGLGRALVQEAVRLACSRGAQHIDVVANPHAVRFYERVGFSDAGDASTRFGPARRMRLDLDPGAPTKAT
jgi:GNAT superfamily N-acetyltransferase